MSDFSPFEPFSDYEFESYSNENPPEYEDTWIEDDDWLEDIFQAHDLKYSMPATLSDREILDDSWKYLTPDGVS